MRRKNSWFAAEGISNTDLFVTAKWINLKLPHQYSVNY
jgi:hypothetical protein